MPRGSGMPPTRRRRPKTRHGRTTATVARIEQLLRQRLAGTWTPAPPTAHDDLEYHRLYARWESNSSQIADS